MLVAVISAVVSLTTSELLYSVPVATAPGTHLILTLGQYQQASYS
jgi:hypothetical protein